MSSSHQRVSILSLPSESGLSQGTSTAHYVPPIHIDTAPKCCLPSDDTTGQSSTYTSRLCTARSGLQDALFSAMPATPVQVLIMP